LLCQQLFSTFLKFFKSRFAGCCASDSLLILPNPMPFVNTFFQVF